MKFPRLQRRPRAAALAFAAVFVGVNTGPVTHAATEYRHDKLVNSAAYKAVNGHWDVVNFPKQYRVNAIHAALLNTGKVLIVAGSGNNQESFDAGSFRTILWDPVTNTFKKIPTPEDMFCSGHAFLPDGRLLVAGGTQRYEILKGTVTHAAGAVTVKNESPDDGPIHFAKGTRLTGPNGKVYRFTNAFTLPAAKKMAMAGGAMVHPSTVVEWAEAIDPGTDSVTKTPGQYSIRGLTGARVHNVYGLAQKMTLEKQDFQGTQTAYLFSPKTERYDRVSDMVYKRWYPTLVGLKDGKILASSGLDGTGQVLTGQTEVFNPRTLKWTDRPDLRRYFPTYPSLFLLGNGRLFYSGSNSGYGPADKGRQPGIWNVRTNRFDLVPGLRRQDLLETSGSVLLPPAQAQKVLVAGGGGVGESPLSTARTDVADLAARNPVFTPGPDLATGTRYPNIVILPDDHVLISGGSGNYRGKFQSDNHLAYLYDARANKLRRVADPAVGRDYHSEGLLLPDGRVVTLGSNPLFSDKKDLVTAPFEQRLEIYTPPYLSAGQRPVIVNSPTNMVRGKRATIELGDATGVASAKLIRPSAVTHVTDVEQRSVALSLRQTGNKLRVTVPRSAGIIPAGWYMLFVTNRSGTPSVARWVHVS